MDHSPPDVKFQQYIQWLKDVRLQPGDIVQAANLRQLQKAQQAAWAEYMAELEASHRPEMPDWLGIDETQIDGKMRCVLTDIGERRILDMLPDRDKATLAG